MTVLIPTTKYKKDIKRMESRGADMTLLDDVVDMIAAGKELPVRYKKHVLKDERMGQIDIHIKPDWLPLYEPDTIEGQEVIFLRRTGSHTDLLEQSDSKSVAQHSQGQLRQRVTQRAGCIGIRSVLMAMRRMIL